ncbi:hypothetical protein MJM45_31135, partial [Salmonella enterica subsp. enterica serovar Kentucky]|nr:hypothetical protein [Salmonella enterica subsp. enterica serovar Kentucky]
MKKRLIRNQFENAFFCSSFYKACQAVINGQPTWAQAHIDAWNAVFKAFGAKPKRTPCSAEALR